MSRNSLHSHVPFSFSKSLCRAGSFSRPSKFSPASQPHQLEATVHCSLSALFVSKSDGQRLKAEVSFSEPRALQNAICTSCTVYIINNQSTEPVGGCQVADWLTHSTHSELLLLLRQNWFLQEKQSREKETWMRSLVTVQFGGGRDQTVDGKAPKGSFPSCLLKEFSWGPKALTSYSSSAPWLSGWQEEDISWT